MGKSFSCISIGHSICAIAPATVKRDCTFPGDLGQCDTNRNDPICVVLSKVAKASTEGNIAS
jgi:hypothetical protein